MTGGDLRGRLRTPAASAEAGKYDRGVYGRQRSLTGGACGPQRSLAGYFKSPYPANLAGVPDARGRWIESNAGMSHDGAFMVDEKEKQRIESLAKCAAGPNLLYFWPHIIHHSHT